MKRVYLAQNLFNEDDLINLLNVFRTDSKLIYMDLGKEFYVPIDADLVRKIFLSNLWKMITPFDYKKTVNNVDKARKAPCGNHLSRSVIAESARSSWYQGRLWRSSSVSGHVCQEEEIKAWYGVILNIIHSYLEFHTPLNSNITDILCWN